MVFITGPLFSGKKSTAKSLMHWDDTMLEQNAVWDVEQMVSGCSDLEKLADRLAEKQVVIASEIGGGVVPVAPEQRAQREAAGRLSCLLAQRADTVIRVFCGIPTVLKGEIRL